MNNIGLVTVIIPTYKRPLTLARAINSILNQSYKNIEIIIVDDNNDEDEFRKETELLMGKYLTYNNVRYLKHTKNQNGSAARNTGLLYSTGDYICFLDDDDFFLPQKVENQLKVLTSANAKVGGVCSNFAVKFKKYIYKYSSNQGCFSNSFSLLAMKNDFAAGSTLMIKREVYSNIGNFDSSYKRHQDWEFLIRFFRKYELLICPSIDVVLSVEGFRLRPNYELLKISKAKLYSDFCLDINKFSLFERNVIKKAQCLEIFRLYIVNHKVREGLKYLKKQGFNVINRTIILYIITYYILSLNKNFTIIMYKLLGLKNRIFKPKFYKMILYIEKKIHTLNEK